MMTYILFLNIVVWLFIEKGISVVVDQVGHSSNYYWNRLLHEQSITYNYVDNFGIMYVGKFKHFSRKYMILIYVIIG